MDELKKEEVIQSFLNKCNIHFSTYDELNHMLISRETLLNEETYTNAAEDIPLLKKIFSSSLLTSLQTPAKDNQRWPLINIVRQVLKARKYNLKPIRRSAGYDKAGNKKYSRFYLIEKM